ncbi:GAF and ANTAR domain-containing protein [Mycobacterium hodleri]|uniref:GAF and ANTAR domain-containing protein n=1 Tax=Mycolicibacterium hodleri TaxID=49897 RepID=UPI0021F2EBC6|nr:GAF and ANTAR domain-containing protein [Mycolicibacterium hodleri]MCV7132397.1 GAF and ANTAR domain-containing protein [Mycolicibacterium hodleri]
MTEVTASDADVADLRAGIDALAGLLAGSLALPELLAQVAAFTCRAIPGADGAAVTLLQFDTTVAALAASAPFVAAIDEIQYVTLGEGPGITAARGRRPVRSGSLGGEKKWPRFGPRVGRMGVHSVLALPLLLPDRVVGAITVYAYAKDVFDDHAEELGELFAHPAAAAVHNAQVLTDALVLNAQLQRALSSRPVIDQAIGIIRARTGRTAEDAFVQLQGMSQGQHRKLADVATLVVDEAVRRAQARNKTP